MSQVKVGDRVRIKDTAAAFAGRHFRVLAVNPESPYDNERVQGYYEGISFVPHNAKRSDLWNAGHLPVDVVPNETSNDEIPADEMLLAAAVAEAKARGLTWCKGRPFVDELGRGTDIVPEHPKRCCAIGAIALTAQPLPGEYGYTLAQQLLTPLAYDHTDVYMGNDTDNVIDGNGATDLGRAFRDAMGGND